MVLIVKQIAALDCLLCLRPLSCRHRALIRFAVPSIHMVSSGKWIHWQCVWWSCGLSLLLNMCTQGACFLAFSVQLWWCPRQGTILLCLRSVWRKGGRKGFESHVKAWKAGAEEAVWRGGDFEVTTVFLRFAKEGGWEGILVQPLIGLEGWSLCFSQSLCCSRVPICNDTCHNCVILTSMKEQVGLKL